MNFLVIVNRLDETQRHWVAWFQDHEAYLRTRTTETWPTPYPKNCPNLLFANVERVLEATKNYIGTTKGPHFLIDLIKILEEELENDRLSNNPGTVREAARTDKRKGPERSR